MRWEYISETFNIGGDDLPELERELNHMGRDRWEAFSITGMHEMLHGDISNTYEVVVLFKREFLR
jgi:hypothetical protein